MITFLKTILYVPLFNALIFLVGIMPVGDVGLAVVALTLLVRLVLSPFSYKAILSQVKQRELQPHISEIRERYKNDKQEQSKKIFELYREHGLSPFSGCLPIILMLLVQLPILIALYYVFRNGLEFPDLLYSFVQMPEIINTQFLGLVDVNERSIVLALLAGASQFVQLRLSPTMNDVSSTKTQDDKGGIQGQVMKNMQKQMKYVMPVMIAVFAYTLPSSLALYWTVTNIYTIGQELVIKRRLAKQQALAEAKDHE